MTPFLTLALVSQLIALLVLLRIAPKPDFSGGSDAKLLRLLKARAAGEIDDAEFASRQQALHASLLAAPAGRAKLRRIWALPFLVAGTALTWLGWPDKHEPNAMQVANSMMPAHVSPAPLLDSVVNKDGMKVENAGDLRSLAKPLADKLAKDPNNGSGWLLLARTYRELHEYGQAVPAYEQAAALLPPDAAMLAEWADAYIVSHGRQWDDTARGIVKRALSTDGSNLMALALAGSEAFDRQDYKSAIGYWDRMRSHAGKGSMDAKLAETNIREANAKLAQTD